MGIPHTWYWNPRLRQFPLCSNFFSFSFLRYSPVVSWFVMILCTLINTTCYQWGRDFGISTNPTVGCRVNRSLQPCALLTGHFFLFFDGSSFLVRNNKKIYFLSVFSLFPSFFLSGTHTLGSFEFNEFHQSKMWRKTQKRCYMNIGWYTCLDFQQIK